MIVLRPNFNDSAASRYLINEDNFHAFDLFDLLFAYIADISL